MNWKKVLIILLLLALTACTTKKPGPSHPVDNPITSVNEAVVPEQGQPPFPPLTDWVMDINGACGFSQETIKQADRIFEDLKRTDYAEVAVICINGVKSNEQIWLTGWGNYTRLGNESGRGAVWLIRPDVRPEENRVTIENSDWLYQNTAIDYYPYLEEAAQFANYGRYTSSLETIARWATEVVKSVVDPNNDLGK